VRELGEKWAAGDKDARKEVDAALAKAGLTIDDATAKTMESKLDSFERLDRMLASAEARRNNALREIDRHRNALGGGVRRSIEEIEDAEFRDVETGEAAAEAKP
jgi:protein-tyrosine-phosphatase